MLLIVFWSSYLMLVFGLFMWLAEHPLRVGGLVLFLYMVGSVVVGFSVRFVVGVFLFLTGVRGMMVAFLYVVALCPNPVFTGREGEVTYNYLTFVVISLSFLGPCLIIGLRNAIGLSVEMEALSESFQWLRDPCICAGLADLMPFLGVLLFLCIIRVVALCGQQKQCLGGHGLGFRKRSYI